MWNLVLSMFIWSASSTIKKKGSNVVGNTEIEFSTEDNIRDLDKEPDTVNW